MRAIVEEIRRKESRKESTLSSTLAIQKCKGNAKFDDK